MNVPPGKSGAVLAVVDKDGTHLALAFKVKDSWKLAADADRTWNGDVTGFVGLVGSW